MSSRIVGTVRGDVFETPNGLVFKSCACDGRNLCLYHHFYDVVAKSPEYRGPQTEPAQKRGQGKTRLNRY
jgi:hypothetical protein